MCSSHMGPGELSDLILLKTNFGACLWRALWFVVLIFKSFMDNLAKLNILTGERQRGESWALENVLNPTPGSQDQAVCSQSFQISNIITVVITQNTYIPSFFLLVLK